MRIIQNLTQQGITDMFKKIHWLFKYYFFAFIFIFGTASYLRSLEPKVNWSFYSKDVQEIVENAVIEKKCESLEMSYETELASNFKQDIFGFNIRKDGRSVKGLNLLAYIKHHLKKNDCS